MQSIGIFIYEILMKHFQIVNFYIIRGSVVLAFYVQKHKNKIILL